MGKDRYSYKVIAMYTPMVTHDNLFYWCLVWFTIRLFASQPSYKFRSTKCHNIIQYECGKYPRIFHGILSIPHNVVMNMNNIMIANLHLYSKYWTTELETFHLYSKHFERSNLKNGRKINKNVNLKLIYFIVVD
jgi:hypothetical protein